MAPGPSFFLGVRPGELLYSMLARHSEAMGARGPKAVMQALLGRENAIATIDLPNNLETLARRLPAHPPLDPGGLAWAATLLPYYTAFQDAAVVDRAVASMMGAGGSIHLMLGVPTFRTHRPTHLQFCRSCHLELSEAYGSSHWRSAHQLPGVLVCPDHGEVLRLGAVRISTANRHEFHAASDAICGEDAIPVATGMSVGELAGAVAIARASAALLDGPAVPMTGEERLADYRALLRGKGFVKGRHKVDQRRLASGMRLHWGGLLGRVGVDGLEADGETWLASLVRSSGGAQPPLQHVLLRLFLDAQPSVAPAEVRINAPRRRGRVSVRRKSVARSRVDWPSIDAVLKRRIRDAARTILTMEPPVRVTLASLERSLGRRDWLSKRIGKLPLSWAAVRAVREDVTAFRFRRLRWHADNCRAEGVDDPWILLRRAGLSGVHIDAARNELKPRSAVHADELRRAA